MLRCNRCNIVILMVATVWPMLSFLTIETAFIGYVLPWGQISFWSATVITNLLSAIPYVGKKVVQWVWGGFAVDNATLTRFFALHFLIPFVIAAVVLIILLFLHQTGSNNPLGLNKNTNKIPFRPYFTVRDILGFAITIIALTVLTLKEPYILKRPRQLHPSRSLSNTSTHSTRMVFDSYTVLFKCPQRKFLPPPREGILKSAHDTGTGGHQPRSYSHQNRVSLNMMRRAQLCIDAGGNHLQHLLW